MGKLVCLPSYLRLHVALHMSGAKIMFGRVGVADIAFVVDAIGISAVDMSR